MREQTLLAEGPGGGRRGEIRYIKITSDTYERVHIFEKLLPRICQRYVRWYSSSLGTSLLQLLAKRSHPILALAKRLHPILALV